MIPITGRGRYRGPAKERRLVCLRDRVGQCNWRRVNEGGEWLEMRSHRQAGSGFRGALTGSGKEFGFHFGVSGVPMEDFK